MPTQHGRGKISGYNVGCVGTNMHWLVLVIWWGMNKCNLFFLCDFFRVPAWMNYFLYREIHFPTLFKWSIEAFFLFSVKKDDRVSFKPGVKFNMEAARLPSKEATLTSYSSRMLQLAINFISRLWFFFKLINHQIHFLHDSSQITRRCTRSIITKLAENFTFYKGKKPGWCRPDLNSTLPCPWTSLCSTLDQLVQLLCSKPLSVHFITLVFIPVDD
jgi:hypothetical protein